MPDNRYHQRTIGLQAQKPTMRFTVELEHFEINFNYCFVKSVCVRLLLRFPLMNQRLIWRYFNGQHFVNYV